MSKHQLHEYLDGLVEIIVARSNGEVSTKVAQGLLLMGLQHNQEQILDVAFPKLNQRPPFGQDQLEDLNGPERD